MPGMLTGIAAVITALAGMITVVYQSDLLRSEAPGSAPTNSRGGDRLPANAGAAVPELQRENPPPGELGQVRVGHYAFKLLGSKLESYLTDANGKPQSSLSDYLFV